MLKYIGVIDASREVIENAPLVPAWEAKFREEALIRTVHHGTHIEGNALNLQEAGKVIAGGDIVGRDRDVQEVLNYRNVIQKIESFSNDIILEEDIKKLHEVTVYKILDEEHIGQYRKVQVVVKNSQTGEITFRPPAAVEIPFLIQSFLEWLNGLSSKDIHPVIKAGITHYEIVRIHPFLDGNGRVARSLATLVLSKEQYDVKRFFSLEEHYDKEPTRYYTSLQNVAEKHGDLTGWLDYFIEGLAIELNRIKEKVKTLSTDIKLKKSMGGKQLALSERQIKVVEYIQDNGFLQNKAFFELFPMISEDTVLRELKDLIKKGIVKKQGVTKGVKYVLKQ